MNQTPQSYQALLIGFGKAGTPWLMSGGRHEKQAIAQGYQIRVATLPAAAVPRVQVLRDHIYTHPAMRESLNDLFGKL